MKLTIEDGRDSFYTFDTNRILLLTATDEEQINQVEFSTEENGETVSWTSDVLTGEDGIKYVQVPNEFLNGNYSRLVCYYVALDSKGEYTRQKEVFRIRARQEPEDYYLTYSERVTFASIKALTEQYKVNASNSADLARRYANEDEDVNVETGTYSSKHWSAKSEKKFQEIKEYVGSSSNPESALGSIESARASAVSDVNKQKTDSIEAVRTYTSNTAIPSVSQYVDSTAKPALKTYGEQQVDSYVSGTSKPELDRYVNNEKKQVLDNYTAEKKSDLDTYTETDKKQILDSYTENEKKAELNTHVEGLKGQLDSHTVAKAGELNEYTTSLKGTLDGYTTAKEQDISEFTEQKKTEVQGVYQNDLNELKHDLDELKEAGIGEIFSNFTMEDGYYINANGQKISYENVYSASDPINVDDANAIYTELGSGTAIAFYDVNSNFISSITVTEITKKWWYLNAPSNAKTFRFTNKIGGSSPMPNSEIKCIKLFKQDTFDKFSEEVKENTELLKDFHKIRHIMTEQKYVDATNGQVVDISATTFKCSDMIEITGDVLYLYTCWSDVSNSYAFYNDFGRYISGGSGDVETGKNNYVLRKITIPSGAKYIRYTNWSNTNDSYIMSLPIEKAFVNLLSAYDNLTFIGDSLTACMVYTSQTQDRFARKKWGDIVAHLSGANSDIYAVGGYTSTDAWNAYKDDIVQKDNQLYVVYLGTNGGFTDTIETDCAGDDYTQYADTYTGNYGKILGKIKSLGKKAILVKVYAPLAIRDLTNKVIDDFGQKFDFPVIEPIYNKDYCYHCYTDKTGVNEVHYNDLGYTYFAYEFIKRVDELSDEEKTKLVN